MDCPMPGLPMYHQLPELAQTHVHQVGDVIQPSHPLLLLLPSVFPSITVFSKESVLRIRWPKYWSFNLSISPSNEYSGLISFRMYWLDPLVVQGTLTSVLQHQNSEASILCCSAFFIVQLSHPYMTIGKTMTLTRQTFVRKVMSLLLKVLFRLAIAFLSRSMDLLISWLQSLSAEILETKTTDSHHKWQHPKEIYSCMFLSGSSMYCPFWTISQKCTLFILASSNILFRMVVVIV